MAKGDKYFTFPLSVLNGIPSNRTALDCLQIASECGSVNAGKGFLNRNDSGAFAEKLEEACEHYSLGDPDTKRWRALEKFYVVGAKICGLNLPIDYDTGDAAHRVSRLAADGQPFIRMSSSSLWSAIYQARYDADPTLEKQKHSLSWREFRVLAAILSWPKTKEGFTTPSVASIQFRSCGFVNRSDFDKAKRLPDHLPKLSPKQITATLKTLEALKMFSRFRLSTSPKGGRMAYSFKHSREELAEAVCSKVNFQDRQKVTQNRAEDILKCLALLERAKSGQSADKVGGKGDQREGESVGQSGGESGGQT